MSSKSADSDGDISGCDCDETQLVRWQMAHEQTQRRLFLIPYAAIMPKSKKRPIAVGKPRFCRRCPGQPLLKICAHSKLGLVEDAPAVEDPPRAEDLPAEDDRPALPLPNSPDNPFDNTDQEHPLANTPLPSHFAIDPRLLDVASGSRMELTDSEHTSTDPMFTPPTVCRKRARMNNPIHGEVVGAMRGNLSWGIDSFVFSYSTF